MKANLCTYFLRVSNVYGITLFLQDLKAILDGGKDLPFPDGLLVNGRGSNGYTFTVDQGKEMSLQSDFISTYDLSVS